MRPRVVLANDHAAVLDAIARLLAPHYDVLGTAGNGLEALRLATTLAPDAVVLDLAMPGLDGLAVATVTGSSLFSAYTSRTPTGRSGTTACARAAAEYREHRQGASPPPCRPTPPGCDQSPPRRHDPCAVKSIPTDAGCPHGRQEDEAMAPMEG
jgi:hypothetical protein